MILDGLLLEVFHEFISLMERRLEKKGEEGFVGWDDTDLISDNEIESRLLEAAAVGRFVDVANFSMFLYYRQKEREGRFRE